MKIIISVDFFGKYVGYFTSAFLFPDTSVMRLNDTYLVSSLSMTVEEAHFLILLTAHVVQTLLGFYMSDLQVKSNLCTFKQLVRGNGYIWYFELLVRFNPIFYDCRYIHRKTNLWKCRRKRRLRFWNTGKKSAGQNNETRPNKWERPDGIMIFKWHKKVHEYESRNWDLKFCIKYR